MTDNTEYGSGLDYESHCCPQQRAGYRRFAPILLMAALLAGIAPQIAFSADYFNGREVYQMHCESCHGADGRSMVPGTPDFSSGDTLFRTDSDLFKQIREGTGVMPAYRGMLSDGEIRDVIAYLRSLQR